MKKEPSYLFLCGCARSGTTALWELLVSEKSVLIGLERYIHQVDKSYNLKPDLYDKDRFFKHHKSDNHFPDLDSNGKAGNFYRDAMSHWEDAQYKGDKLPKLYLHLEQHFNLFPQSKLIFIFRNIFDVAASFENRLANKQNNWKRGFRKAVEEWNTSLNAIMPYLKDGRVLILNYEELFYGNYDVNRLQEFLSIDLNGLKQKLNKMQAKHKAGRGKQKLQVLKPLQVHYISNNANFEAYKKLSEPVIVN